MKRCLYFLIAAPLFLCYCTPRYAPTTPVSYNSGYNNNSYDNGYNNYNNNNNQPVGYDAFYNELSPYGRWIDYPGYGYVWSPNAEPGFRPYSSDGHWVYSD